MPIADPQPGDLLLNTNGQGGVFIYKVLANGKHDWLASSTAFLRQRGVSRYGPHKPAGEINYRPAPDFTVGRVFDKGQARHLIARYFPEMAAGNPPPRILLHIGGWWHTDETKPLIPERKPRPV
jgi:hypothetical protein